MRKAACGGLTRQERATAWWRSTAELASSCPRLQQTTRQRRQSGRRPPRQVRPALVTSARGELFHNQFTRRRKYPAAPPPLSPSHQASAQRAPCPGPWTAAGACSRARCRRSACARRQQFAVHRASRRAHQVINLVVALKVPQPARQQVYVHVRHGLAGRGAVLHGERECVRAKVRLQLRPAAVRQAPQVRSLLARQLCGAAHNAPRDEQDVAWPRVSTPAQAACEGAHLARPA